MMMKQYEAATLKKGLRILDALTEKDMTLTDVMHHFSFKKSTAFRLLYTLESMGYIKKTGHVYRSSHKTGAGLDQYEPMFNWLSVPPLIEMSEEVEETAYVGVLYKTDVVTAQVVDGPHSIRAHSRVGDRSPVHLSALGKVMLAFLGEEQQSRVLEELKLTPNTDRTFVDSHLFKEHLKVIRSQGYAVDDEETEKGLRCIAAPVILQGKVIAAIAVSGPAERLHRKRDKSVGKALTACSTLLAQLFETAKSS
ncbi:IclR family transcriptional regulator [Halobacillus kuroshimensis]|uniref:IclR family transcriptional regulator n=1 Tax=Halobacillus kuroshimensis TaxID=302481 RepID=A0ABS3DR30_9BACI|nr:IclR family transcriptional regulator [Halobacillus kuroshimensis]MBN8233790.1 IclR family transcriptional regulator [Halobacillus kuroshimensis]